MDRIIPVEEGVLKVIAIVRRERDMKVIAPIRRGEPDKEL